MLREKQHDGADPRRELLAKFDATIADRRRELLARVKE
jgi:hypothetical protein